MMSWLQKLMIGLMTSFETIGGVPVDVISRPTFKRSASLLDIMGKSKLISQDPKIVDLHKSGSSLGPIFKCLKVPRTSVQTIVRKYKHHGATSHHTAQEGDVFCLLEINVLW